MSTTKIPVIAVGGKYDVTLVFPTQAASHDPRHCAVWDAQCGHGAGSKYWVVEQPISPKYYAQEMLEKYCKWYDTNVEDYQLVAHWTEEYDNARRFELEELGT